MFFASTYIKDYFYYVYFDCDIARNGTDTSKVLGYADQESVVQSYVAVKRSVSILTSSGSPIDSQAKQSK